MRLIFLLILGLSSILHGQSEAFSISGRVVDATTTEALPYANVYLEELRIGSLTDEDGFFVLPQVSTSSSVSGNLESVPAGEYHLRISHIGCEPERVFLKLTQDTFMEILLVHHSELIDEVVVHGQASDNSTQSSSTLTELDILQSGDGNLGQLLDEINGVSTLRSGAGISKPVIHGLFGNRITILNNGVAQSGQQWGNDHAPEIDPFIASHISVLKGVAALSYQGSTLGSVVMIEPANIEEEPHLHGSINYLYNTNGRGHTFNTRLEQATPLVNWRFTGTLRYQGDTRTPDYWLTNTGRREANAALQLEKEISPRLQTSLYYSLFTTELGILRGSHIGNLTDLERAFSSETPFYTANSFSYEIEAPRQTVAHHLLKVEARLSLANDQLLRFRYAGQLNDRQEFDVRRGDRDRQAALDLLQFDHQLGLTYNRPLGKHNILSAGLQLQYTENDNQPGTGILPLIPDYTSIRPASFLSIKQEQDRWQSEIGIRYAFTQLDVQAISRDLPRRIEEFSRQFHNISAVAGLKFRPKPGLSLAANLGMARRGPEVNELYSSGLHQGVSGIEEGDPSLQEETSLKGTLALDWSPNHHFFLQLLTYYQRIDNYIYLQPQEEFRLTIRGSFPVFIYEQTAAEIAGLDLLFSVEPSEQLKVVTKYSYLRGQDRTNNLPLVFMPANRLSSSIQYAFADGKRLHNTQLSLEGEYTFRQNRLEIGQDLLAPPDAYFLLSLKASTHLELGNQSLHFNLRVDNILNTTYRNYLNRLRYFADELGRNLVLGLSWEF